MIKKFMWQFKWAPVRGWQTARVLLGRSESTITAPCSIVICMLWEYVYVYMYTIYMYIMSIDCSSERSIIFYSPTTSFLFFFFHVYIMYVLTYTWFYIFGQTQQRRLSSESFVLLDFCMLIFTQAHAASQSYRDSYSSKIILCYFFFVLYPTALYKY